jgi:polysaccharide biosynthesis transport protein
MVVQIEPPGQLQEFLEILKRRKWQVLLPALFIISLGVSFAVIVPKKYEVVTQIELRPLLLDNMGDARAAREQTKGVAENAPEQIKSMRRITEVIEDLKWPDYLGLDQTDRAEYRKRIRDNISVVVPRKGDTGSAFVTITYLDVDQERAQVFLKELRNAWIQQVVDRDRTRISVEHDKLLDRAADLEREWLKRSGLLTQLRLDNDISPTQPTPGKNEQRFEDPTVDRHARNRDRLDAVEIELQVAEAEFEVKLAQLAETEPEVPKLAVVKGVSYVEQIGALRKQSLELEEQLDGIRKAHSRYELTLRKLESIDEQIRDLEDLQTENEISKEFRPNPAYGALENKIAALETSIARLEAERSTLHEVLAADKEEAIRLAQAYREDSEHSTRIGILTETMLEVEGSLQKKKQQREVVYGPAGNPFQIMMEVEPPSSPSQPDPVLILVFAAVMGLAVGLGATLMAEFSKSCFRSTGDIVRVMVVPVLGVISPIVTRRQRRLRVLRRIAMGGASLLLIGSIQFITWAWSLEPDLLSAGLVDSIESFRLLFL